jgi:response regulator RpfG family c-di-GMP phosphodiesterase
MDYTPIIYIIDDDLDDQEFLIETIKEIDPSIQCFTAVNGYDGYQKLETKRVPHPSLIFLDINMPRMDGYKFLKEMKSHRLFMSIPIIIYTTSSNDKDKEAMMALGALDYIVKEPNLLILKEKMIHLFATMH